MLVGLWAIEQPLLCQVLCHQLAHLGGFLSNKPVIALDVDAEIIHRREHGQAKLFGEAEVLATAAGGDMYNASTLGRADLFPGYDSMLDSLHSGQLVERTAILPASQIMPFERLNHVVIALVATLERLEHRKQVFSQIVELAVLLHLHIGKLRVDRGGYVRGQRPGRGGPDQQVLAGPVNQRQAHVQAEVLDLLVILG